MFIETLMIHYCDGFQTSHTKNCNNLHLDQNTNSYSVSLNTVITKSSNPRTRK